MATHENDCTMDVMIGGVVERRAYSINTSSIGCPPRCEPELQDGERAVWQIGSDMPIIIQDRPSHGLGYSSNPVDVLYARAKEYAAEQGLELDEPSFRAARSFMEASTFPATFVSPGARAAMVEQLRAFADALERGAEHVGGGAMVDQQGGNMVLKSDLVVRMFP